MGDPYWRLWDLAWTLMLGRNAKSALRGLMVLNQVVSKVRLLTCLNLFQQRRLLGYLAKHNEYYKLELPGAAGGLGTSEQFVPWKMWWINKSPTLVFLMETGVDKKEWIDKVKKRYKLKHGAFVPSNGNSGGLALFWKDGVTIWKFKEHAKHYECLDSQFTNYQFKLNIKQLMSGT